MKRIRQDLKVLNAGPKLTEWMLILEKFLELLRSEPDFSKFNLQIDREAEEDFKVRKAAVLASGEITNPNKIFKDRTLTLTCLSIEPFIERILTKKPKSLVLPSGVLPISSPI